MTTPTERAAEVLEHRREQHIKTLRENGEPLHVRALVGSAYDSARDALDDAGLLPDHEEWAETLENDGTYEYTTTGDCHGTWEKRLRRTPRRATGPSEWEEVPDGE